MTKLHEELIEKKTVFTGKVLTMRYDRVRLPNGHEATREVVEHPGAVAVVPVTAEGKVVLVRQYRYPVEEVLLEIPAGKLDKGEPPEACAHRELEEETGFKTGRLEHLATFYTAPGFTDEIMHLYLARDLTETAQRLDEDEFLAVGHYTAAEIKALLAEKKINDAKTLVGLMMAGFSR
jgi:ADP-ribose pyrophosphatase